MSRRLLPLAALVFPALARAAETAGVPKSVDTAAWVLVIAALPIAAVVLSCYVKMAVVLSVLRAGLGSSIPPRSVAFAVAVLLSAFVMAPVAEGMWSAAAPALVRGDAASLAAGAASARAPLVDFLSHH